MYRATTFLPKTPNIEVFLMSIIKFFYIIPWCIYSFSSARFLPNSHVFFGDYSTIDFFEIKRSLQWRPIWWTDAIEIFWNPVIFYNSRNMRYFENVLSSKKKYLIFNKTFRRSSVTAILIWIVGFTVTSESFECFFFQSIFLNISSISYFQWS